MNIGGKWMRKVIPTLTIVILIALASLQTIPGQEDVNAGDVNASVQNVSDQQPCDNLTRHLENVGIIISGKYVQDGKERIFDWGVPVGFVRIKKDTADKWYYVNCVSGDVHEINEEPPAYTLSDPLLSKIDSSIRFKAKFAPDDYKFWIVVLSSVPIGEKGETLESLGMEMDGSSSTSDYKLRGHATYDSILKIAELDFVTRITLEMIATGGGGGSNTEPRITLVANSIDYSLATDFIGYWKNIGMRKSLTHITALDFEQHKGGWVIVILGGPDAPEGVGEIVQQILTKEEQASVRVQGSRKMFSKENLWASEHQTIFIIAGSDRNQTKLASSESENQGTIRENVGRIWGL